MQRKLPAECCGRTCAVEPGSNGEGEIYPTGESPEVIFIDLGQVLIPDLVRCLICRFGISYGELERRATALYCLGEIGEEEYYPELGLEAFPARRWLEEIARPFYSSLSVLEDLRQVLPVYIVSNYPKPWLRFWSSYIDFSRAVFSHKQKLLKGELFEAAYAIARSENPGLKRANVLVIDDKPSNIGYVVQRGFAALRFDAGAHSKDWLTQSLDSLRHGAARA